MTFYEDKTVVDRVVSMIKSGELPNVRTLSEYCRRAFRLVAAYPELLTEGQPRVPSSTIPSEAIRDLEKNLVFLIERNHSTIQSISQQIVGLKNWIKENTLRVEISDMVESLLKNPKVFTTRTISELEELLPYQYMLDFVPDILHELKRRGSIVIEPGDRLRWLRDE